MAAVHDSDERSMEHDLRRAVAALPVRKAKTRTEKDSQGVPRSTCGPCYMKQHRSRSTSTIGRDDSAKSSVQSTLSPADAARSGTMARPASGGRGLGSASQEGPPDAPTPEGDTPACGSTSVVLSHTSHVSAAPLNVGGDVLVRANSLPATSGLMPCNALVLHCTNVSAAPPPPQDGRPDQRHVPLRHSHDPSLRGTTTELALVSSGGTPTPARQTAVLDDGPHAGSGPRRPNKTQPPAHPALPPCGDYPSATLLRGSEPPANQPCSGSAIG